MSTPRVRSNRSARSIMRPAWGSILAVAASIGALAGGSTPHAEAYTKLGCKFPGSNPTITYAIYVPTTAFATATTAGAGRWNAVAVPGTFKKITSGTPNISVTGASFVDGSIYAQTSGSCSGGTWVKSQTTFTWNYEGSISLSSTAKRMVATHELGHSYGLGHTTPTKCSNTKSVMVQGPLKWTCGWGTEPWTDDINGVKAVYK